MREMGDAITWNLRSVGKKYILGRLSFYLNEGAKGSSEYLCLYLGKGKRLLEAAGGQLVSHLSI